MTSNVERAVKLLTFAKELAWEAERRIPDNEGKRLKSILNSIRHSYVGPALKLLDADSSEAKNR